VRINDEDIETEFPLACFPSPAELWQRYKIYRGIKDDAEALVIQPYHLDASGKEPRYYQVEAINRTIEAVALGQKRNCF
jgi:type I restriction enzyme R subunit